MSSPGAVGPEWVRPPSRSCRRRGRRSMSSTSKSLQSTSPVTTTPICRDPDAVSQTVASIDGEINALFYCAGRAGSKFPDDDVMTVNFLSARLMAELLVPHMPPGSAIASISSTAGIGWMANTAKWMPLVTTTGFAAGRTWVEEHPDEIAGGYAPRRRPSSYGHCGLRTPGPTRGSGSTRSARGRRRRR